MNYEEFKHTPKQVAESLSRRRLHGTALINICGTGETLFSVFALELARELLNEGHFVIIATNGTPTKAFKTIALLPSAVIGRLAVKFSFHYLELRRLNLFDVFWKNVRITRNAGAGISLEMCPTDELIPYIEDIKKICLENAGAFPHLTNARDQRTDDFRIMTKLPPDEYKKTWGAFHGDMFDLKFESFGVKRTEFCYAGDWSAYMNAATGRMWSCHFGKEISGDICRDVNNPIPFSAVGKCAAPYCVNAHCGMGMGCLPDVKAPSFCAVRDRECLDGTHWLTTEWIKFSSQKLYDNNRRYSKIREWLLCRASECKRKRRHSIWWHLRHLRF